MTQACRIGVRGLDETAQVSGISSIIIHGPGSPLFFPEEKIMINVSSKVKIHEIGGSQLEVGAEKILVIESHWNRVDLINIILPGFDIISVHADDLKAAIENAQNANRY